MCLGLKPKTQPNKITHPRAQSHTHMRRMSKFQHFVWDKLRRITWQDPSQYSISQLLRFVLDVLGGGGGVTKGVRNWQWVVLPVFVFIRIWKNVDIRSVGAYPWVRGLSLGCGRRRGYGWGCGWGVASVYVVLIWVHLQSGAGHATKVWRLYIYICTCGHAWTHTQKIYIGTYLHIPTYVHTYIRTYVHTYIRTYVHTYIRTYVHTYIRTYVPTYIHTYLHTYIHGNMHKWHKNNICVYLLLCAGAESKSIRYIDRLFPLFTILLLVMMMRTRIMMLLLWVVVMGGWWGWGWGRWGGWSPCACQCRYQQCWCICSRTPMPSQQCFAPPSEKIACFFFVQTRVRPRGTLEPLHALWYQYFFLGITWHYCSVNLEAIEGSVHVSTIFFLFFPDSRLEDWAFWLALPSPAQKRCVPRLGCYCWWCSISVLSNSCKFIAKPWRVLFRNMVWMLSSPGEPKYCINMFINFVFFCCATCQYACDFHSFLHSTANQSQGNSTMSHYDGLVTVHR